MKRIAITLVFLFAGSTAHTAPIPGTASSDLMKGEIGKFTSKYGFEIATNSSEWLQTEPPTTSKFIETVYRSPFVRNNTRATLSVRVDRLKKKAKLSNYVRRWVKEYPKYGYDVLGSKRFKAKGRSGYVIDLLNTKKKRQLRQVIYLKGRTAVLMTCRDHLESFRSSLAECNKIVKGFNWQQTN